MKNLDAVSVIFLYWFTRFLSLSFLPLSPTLPFNYCLHLFCLFPGWPELSLWEQNDIHVKTDLISVGTLTTLRKQSTGFPASKIF